MWMANTQARDGRPILVPLLLGLVALAWLALFLWSASPYARFMGHDALAHLPLAAGGNYIYFYIHLLTLFIGGWTLMTVAMMLPTSLPLINLFRAIVRQRANRIRLVILLIVGYLAVWTGFGVFAHIGDWILHAVVARNLWLALHPWVIAVTIFLIAGVYQFTPLKYHCLEKCRSPLTFIMEHWHGRHAKSEALALGIRHGLFCLGCCWSLMLVMFAVGMGNIGWMLVLGAFMAVEKNLPGGQRLGKPVGILLITWAALLAFVPAMR